MGQKLKIFFTTMCAGLLLTLWFNGCGQKVVPEEPVIDIFSSISGSITDSITSNPVAGVTISANNKKFVSDSAGRYTIDRLNRGGYSATYSLSGYETVTADYLVSHGSSLNGDIALNKIPRIENIKVSSVSKTGAVISFQTYSSLKPTSTTLITNALVRYSLDSDNLNQTTPAAAASINHSITLGGLEAGKTYYYKVEATDSANKTIANASVVGSFITDDGGSPTLSSTKVTPYTDSAEFRWLTSESATGKIYYGTSESQVTGGGTSIGTETTNLTDLTVDHVITLTGLKPKTKYFYRLESKDGAGNFTQQEMGNFTTAELFAPLLYNPTNITKTSVYLYWDINSNLQTDNLRFKEYQIEAFTSDPTNTTLSPNKSATLTDKSMTSTTLSGLNSSTQYWFRISVVDKGGNKSRSTAVPGITSQDGVHFDNTVTSSPLSGTIKGLMVWKATLADGSDARGWMVGSRGQTARLTNSGTSTASPTWAVVTSPTALDLLAVDGSATQAAASGKSGSLLYSSDNRSWVAIAAGTGVNINDINRYSDGGSLNDSFWYCGYNTLGVLYLNAGVPITRVIATSSLGIASGSWNGISVVGNSVILVGDRGRIASGSFGGSPAGPGAAMDNLLISANSYVLRPTPIALPAQASLNSQASQTNNLNAVAMVSPTQGWIAGNGGIILHLNGTEWFADPVEVNLRENVTSLYAFDSTLAYAVTDKGKILKYDNNSAKWIVVNNFLNTKFEAVAFDPDTTKQFGVAGGENVYTVFRPH